MDRDRIRSAFQSPVPSLRTPFTRQGDIDSEGLRNQVEFVITEGARALIITWGDSLFALLDEQEIAEVTRIVVSQSAGRAVVAGCTGNWSTRRCEEFARFAKDAGVDILMTLGSNWYPECGTLEGVVQHHALVARHLPIMVNTGFIRALGASQGLEAIKRLSAELDGVLAAKCDVQGEFDRKAVLAARDRWSFVSGGTKQFHLELHPYGCQGHMTTLLHFRPPVARGYWAAVQKNDLAAAVAAIEKYDFPFFEYIGSLKGGFDAGMHGMLEVVGRSQRWRRAPFYSLSDEEMEKLRGFAKGLGLV